jgi:hypothetical protein
VTCEGPYWYFQSLAALTKSLDAAVWLVLCGIAPSRLPAIGASFAPFGPDAAATSPVITLTVNESETTGVEVAELYRLILQERSKELDRPQSRAGRNLSRAVEALAMVALEVRHVDRFQGRRGYAAAVLHRWPVRAAQLGHDPTAYRTVGQVSEALRRIEKRAGFQVFD